MPCFGISGNIAENLTLPTDRDPKSPAANRMLRSKNESLLQQLTPARARCSREAKKSPLPLSPTQKVRWSGACIVSQETFSVQACPTFSEFYITRGVFNRPRHGRGLWPLIVQTTAPYQLLRGTTVNSSTPSFSQAADFLAEPRLHSLKPCGGRQNSLETPIGTPIS